MVNIEKLKAKKNIKALKDLLSHKKEKVREEACEALGAIGFDASPRLITVLGNRLNPLNSRILAARALGMIHDQSTIPPLIQGLLEEEEVGRECANALTAFGRAAVPHLLHAVRQRVKQMPHVIYVLGKIRDPSVLQNLLELLPHPDPTIRKETIRALGNIGERSVGEHLVGFLADHDPVIRIAAATSLGQLKHADALSYLEQMLFDDQEDVRNAARNAMDLITQFI